MIGTLAVLVWVLSIICVVLMLRVSHWKSEWYEISRSYAHLVDTHAQVCHQLDEQDIELEDYRAHDPGRHRTPPVLFDVSAHKAQGMVQAGGVRPEGESVPGVPPAVGLSEPGAPSGGGGGEDAPRSHIEIVAAPNGHVSPVWPRARPGKVPRRPQGGGG